MAGSFGATHAPTPRPVTGGHAFAAHGWKREPGRNSHGAAPSWSRRCVLEQQLTERQPGTVTKPSDGPLAAQRLIGRSEWHQREGCGLFRLCNTWSIWRVDTVKLLVDEKPDVVILLVAIVDAALIVKAALEAVELRAGQKR
jgi:hypothetical protein